MAAAAEVGATAFFLPTRLGAIEVGALDRLQFVQAIEQTGLPKGIVFANAIIDIERPTTWALYSGSSRPRSPPE